jgi:hypothetical protein
MHTATKPTSTKRRTASISRRRLLFDIIATRRRNGKATRARLRSLASNLASNLHELVDLFRSLQDQRVIRLRWAATKLFVVQTDQVTRFLPTGT